MAARAAAHLETDWLWFQELHQERVFWTLLTARWLVGAMVGLATAGLLVANVWIVQRAAPSCTEPRGGDTTRLRRAVLVAGLLICTVAGVVAGRGVMGSGWQQIMLWLHRGDFGVTDPIFHRDVGFFVFSLPLYQQTAHWLFATAGVALACSLAGHAATGAIQLRPAPISATRTAQRHVLALAALMLVVVAWQHRLAQFALELRDRRAPLPGAGYTGIHVELPWLRVLVCVALVAAAAMLFSAVWRSWWLPPIAIVLVVVAEMVNPSILPSVVQRVFVDPQTLTRERPYIRHALRMTRRAYALDQVDSRPFRGDGVISAHELAAHERALQDIQLWDTDVLRPEVDQQQSIGSYYTFPQLTVDRYRRSGETEGLIVAVRQLDLQRVEPSGRTWGNDRLAYTHGYGLVAVPAGDEGVDAQGKPRFATPALGAEGLTAPLRQPRVYYGIQPRGAGPWVIAATRRPEIEQSQAALAAGPDYHYDGAGGIPMSSLVRRAVLALRLGDINVLLSETIGGRARLLLRRDVGERLETLAPFLHWGRPEAASVGGRIRYFVDGYTTSASYPYSAAMTLGGERLNYLRASVVADVDAFDGRVTMYAMDDEDPILHAWRGVFPTLFTPARQLPAGVRAHLRYPRELFAAQAAIWSTYHGTNPDDFYTRDDAWKRPADVTGSVARVGTLANRADARPPLLRPEYTLGRLPGDRRERFMLATPFTPYSQENLTGYLAGSIDAKRRLRLTELDLPRSRRVLGPAQVTRLILADPVVSERLRVLNTETTDLGDRSINSVGIGDPRIVPIAGSFLYVQPIYVTAESSGITRLRLVTVYLNGRVGYGRTLAAALRRARR